MSAETAITPPPGITTVPTGMPAGSAGGGAAPGARHALILLLLINLFNYIDRQVLAAMEPQIRAEFFPAARVAELGDDRVRFLMGLLSSAFLVTYMLASPVFGYLANRTSRWLLIGIGVILWSLASGASGLASAFLAMFLTRCLVGIGEAVYGPVAPDVLSDLYPVKRRGQILALFYAAIPFGGALGYALGDLAFKATDSWRTAFYLVVPPGILLGLWAFLMPEPRRGLSDAVEIGKRKERWADYKILLKTPSYVLNTAGMTLMCFAMGGLAYWAPDYLEWREVQPLFGVIPPKTAFGAMTALCGLLATLAGGWAGDALRNRYAGSYFLVSGLAMLFAFPMLLLMIALPFPLAWIPLALFVFGLFFNTGPTNTILANVTHPLLRAPGFALNILIIHLLGDVISPPIMGFIAGRFGRDASFQFVSAAVLLGGLLWLWGTRYLAFDTALAPNRLPPEPTVPPNP
jgi:MFS family permease